VTGLTEQSTFTTQRSGVGIGISAVDQWNQTYTITPVDDTGSLRRLRVLYQYVTRKLAEGGADAEKEFESIYPLIETAPLGTSAPPTGGAKTTTTTTITVDGKPVTVTQTTEGTTQSKTNNTIYVRRTYLPSPDGRFRGYTWTIVSPDVTFIQQPGCILCDYGRNLDRYELLVAPDKIRKNNANVHKLEKNIDLRDDWLYLPGEQVIADAIPLPSNGLETLYIINRVNGDPDGGRKYFYEFALFNQDAASQGTGSPPSGGQSEGRKTAPLQRISIPVGGINTQ
jgi:hypothetical protein